MVPGRGEAVYGKIFASIFDGSLHGYWEAIVTLEQLIVLCDADGVIEMTPKALAARTSIPLEILERGLAHLLEPDPHSRTPGEEGRRIVLVDPSRPWGWRLVNHDRYRKLRDMEEVRAQTRERVRRHREGRSDPPSLLDLAGNVESREETPCNAGNARKRYTDADTDTEARKDSSAGRPKGPPRGFHVLGKGDESPSGPGAACGRLWLAGGASYAVLEDSFLERSAVLYPAVDPRAEALAMEGWLQANPRRRPTERGILQFVNSWLKRAQDDQRKNGTSTGASRASGDESYARANGIGGRK